MPEQAVNAYDSVYYPSNPLPQTHPDRLATLATLFGMEPAPPSRCRVLELGCGDGGNLIPMAFLLPDSEFVGLDLAAQPVARGQARAAALGLRNVALHARDVCEPTGDLGTFDYVIAHGLYSWVPPAVQDRVMAVCKENLKPQGVAYVSYNAYPGCHQHQAAREILLYHVRPYPDPGERVGQALAFGRYLAENPPDAPPHLRFLQEELKRITRHQDFLVFHDSLAEFNRPAYFHEFAGHAGRHGLQFLAEADFFEMQDTIYPPEVTEALRGMAGDDIVAKEQYLDFIKFRRFRQTLLCHEGVRLERRLRPEQVAGFRLTSPARPVAEQPDLASDAEEQFRGPRGAGMVTNHPLAKAAIYLLGEIYPQSLPFPELVRRARSLLGQPAAEPGPDLDPDTLLVADVLLQTYSAGLVGLHREPPHFAAEPGERPTASRLARLQIEEGETVVADLRHSCAQIEDPLGRQLLLLLDGTRDRAALLGELADRVLSGQAPLKQDGRPVTDPGQVRAILGQILEPGLARLARLALLVA